MRSEERTQRNAARTQPCELLSVVEQQSSRAYLPAAVGGLQLDLMRGALVPTARKIMAQRAQLRSSAAWLVAGGGVCVGLGYCLARRTFQSSARRLHKSSTDDVFETPTTDPDWVPPNKQPPPGGNKGEGRVCVYLLI